MKHSPPYGGQTAEQLVEKALLSWTLGRIPTEKHASLNCLLLQVVYRLRLNPESAPARWWVCLALLGISSRRWLHLLFTMSTLDMDAISAQAALTSVGRPEKKLEKGCPTYTTCFRNCSGVHLTPKTQSAHSSVVAKLSNN